MEPAKIFDKVIEFAPAYIILTLAGQKTGYVGVGTNTPDWFRPAAPKVQTTPTSTGNP